MMETPDQERKYYGEIVQILGSPEHDIGCSGVYSLDTIEKVRFVEASLTKFRTKNRFTRVLFLTVGG